MNIAVIGCGKMGTALVHGWILSGITSPTNIRVLTSSPSSAQALHDRYGVIPATNIADATAGADFIILAVKPFVMQSVIPDVADATPKGTTIISVAAGIPLSSYEAVFGADTAIVRAMPNTPAGIQKGATGIAFNAAVPFEQRETITELFNAVGITEVVPESQMDAVNGLSGSGPGFAFTLIEAMIDGGVLAGLPRPTARRLAAQTMLGAAQLILETHHHPGQLRDMVTTPAGTTMAGLNVLENRAVRAAIMDAVLAAKNRSTELGEQYR
jgi:pyrroline-5-carboxylate reductase